MGGELNNHAPAIRFLIRDYDTKFTTALDTVFRSEGIDVIRTPFQAPNTNAFAECRVRTDLEKYLNKPLIIKHTHLQRVMRVFVAYHNTARPHQGIEQQILFPLTIPVDSGPIRCRNVIGGIIHNYYCEAA